MITITSKYNGFIRCGIHHPDKPTEYPNSRFTADELARLQATPCLTVVVTEASDAIPSTESVSSKSAKKKGA